MPGVIKIRPNGMWVSTEYRACSNCFGFGSSALNTPQAWALSQTPCVQKKLSCNYLNTIVHKIGEQVPFLRILGTHMEFSKSKNSMKIKNSKDFQNSVQHQLPTGQANLNANFEKTDNNFGVRIQLLPKLEEIWRF